MKITKQLTDINGYREKLALCLERKQLIVSVGNFSFTLFSIRIKDWKNHLGSVFTASIFPPQTRLNFLMLLCTIVPTDHEHAKEVNAKVMKWNNGYSAICSKKRGLKRKARITVWRAVAKSNLNNGAAACTPNLSGIKARCDQKQWRLQKMQQGIWNGVSSGNWTVYLKNSGRPLRKSPETRNISEGGVYNNKAENIGPLS